MSHVSEMPLDILYEVSRFFDTDAETTPDARLAFFRRYSSMFTPMICSVFPERPRLYAIVSCADPPGQSGKQPWHKPDFQNVQAISQSLSMHHLPLTHTVMCVVCILTCPIPSKESKTLQFCEAPNVQTILWECRSRACKKCIKTQ